jgi:hypothetical protein
VVVSAPPRSPEAIRAEIAQEREALVAATRGLEEEIASAKDINARLQPKLPLLAAAAVGLGFFLAGGIGATMRLLVRKSRES